MLMQTDICLDSLDMCTNTCAWLLLTHMYMRACVPSPVRVLWSCMHVGLFLSWAQGDTYVKIWMCVWERKKYTHEKSQEVKFRYTCSLRLHPLCTQNVIPSQALWVAPAYLVPACKYLYLACVTVYLYMATLSLHRQHYECLSLCAHAYLPARTDRHI